MYISELEVSRNAKRQYLRLSNLCEIEVCLLSGCEYYECYMNQQMMPTTAFLKLVSKVCKRIWNNVQLAESHFYMSSEG